MEIEEWLLGLAVDESPFRNALCMTLPALVDADPGFVRQASDPETRRRIVLDAPGLRREQRAAKLAWRMRPTTDSTCCVNATCEVRIPTYSPSIS